MPAAPDQNYRSYCDVTDVYEAGRTIDPRREGLDPAAFDDLLKLSHVQRAMLRGFAVRGGGLQRENAIDLNRECADVILDCFSVEAGRQNAVTIKGGCVRTTITHLVIERAGGHCDIELGNWSDQSQAPVRSTVLENVSRADGKLVRLRVGHAERPIIVGGNVEYLWLQSLALKVYWWAKFAWTRTFGAK